VCDIELLNCECCDKDFDPEYSFGYVDDEFNTQCGECIDEVRKEFE